MLNFYAALPLFMAATAAPLSENSTVTIGVLLVCGAGVLAITWRAAVTTTRIDTRLTSVEESNARIEKRLEDLPCKHADYGKEAVCERD